MEDMTARAQALSEMAINLKKVSSQFKITNDDVVSKEMVVMAGAGSRKAESRDWPVRPNEPKLADPKQKEKNKVPAKVKEALSKRGIDAN